MGLVISIEWWHVMRRKKLIEKACYADAKASAEPATVMVWRPLHRRACVDKRNDGFIIEEMSMHFRDLPVHGTDLIGAEMLCDEYETTMVAGNMQTDAILRDMILTAEGMTVELVVNGRAPVTRNDIRTETLRLHAGDHLSAIVRGTAVSRFVMLHLIGYELSPR